MNIRSVLLGLGRLTAAAGLLVSLGLGVIPIASAQDGAESTEGATVELSPECAAFAADKHADLGDVLHATCRDATDVGLADRRIEVLGAPAISTETLGCR